MRCPGRFWELELICPWLFSLEFLAADVSAQPVQEDQGRPLTGRLPVNRPGCSIGERHAVIIAVADDGEEGHDTQPVKISRASRAA